MAICVATHAAGIAGAVRWLRGIRTRAQRFATWTWIFVRVAAWMILLHLLEIGAWAALYTWRQAMPDMRTAVYFSAVTYTTTGYGDLVLPNDWRIVGAIEALTGILMCGWSTGFFFVVASRMFEAPASTQAAS
jgi:hypothetical protein